MQVLLSGSDEPQYSPFSVINGQVFINEGFIRDGTITNAKIGRHRTGGRWGRGSLWFRLANGATFSGSSWLKISGLAESANFDGFEAQAAESAHSAGTSAADAAMAKGEAESALARTQDIPTTFQRYGFVANTAS